MLFSHEKLIVYQKGLVCFCGIQGFLALWSKKHAFVDHLSRAMDSTLFNLAEATRLLSAGKKLLTMDYAVGSAFECAACIDVAVLKGLLDKAVAVEQKERLLEVSQMTARKDYSGQTLRGE